MTLPEKKKDDRDHPPDHHTRKATSSPSPTMKTRRGSSPSSSSSNQNVNTGGPATKHDRKEPARTINANTARDLSQQFSNLPISSSSKNNPDGPTFNESALIFTGKHSASMMMKKNPCTSAKDNKAVGNNSMKAPLHRSWTPRSADMPYSTPNLQDTRVNTNMTPNADCFQSLLSDPQFRHRGYL